MLPEAGIEGAQAMLHRFRRAWAAHQPLTTFSAGIARHEPGSLPTRDVATGRRRALRGEGRGRDCDMLAAESAVEVLLP